MAIYNVTYLEEKSFNIFKKKEKKEETPKATRKYGLIAKEEYLKAKKIITQSFNSDPFLKKIGYSEEDDYDNYVKDNNRDWISIMSIDLDYMLEDGENDAITDHDDYDKYLKCEDEFILKAKEKIKKEFGETIIIDTESTSATDNGTDIFIKSRKSKEDD